MIKPEEFRLATAAGAALIDIATVTAIAAEGQTATRIYVPGGSVVVDGSYVSTRTRLGLDVQDYNVLDSIH